MSAAARNFQSDQYNKIEYRNFNTEYLTRNERSFVIKTIIMCMVSCVSKLYSSSGYKLEGNM